MQLTTFNLKKLKLSLIKFFETKIYGKNVDQQFFALFKRGR